MELSSLPPGPPLPAPPPMPPPPSSVHPHLSTLGPLQDPSATLAGQAGPGGEGDASSALAELDQGLRCGRLGEQSEAIVRFPRLFAKYPFPILINSALLKLADVFRQGPNFIKLCVLRVIQQSQRHLDKITNVDEFVKRIFTVLHSNDPVARALTLRTLGAIAVIIPERKQVHHNIRHALDSHDAVELHAAIFAAGKFASQSKTFAVNMCSKISDMIRGYATPLEMKLKLIPIFQHMHHDAQTAQVVRQMCIEMLPGYPSEDFVIVTLHTLTLLSAQTLVDIPDQVELLIKTLNEETRNSVKHQVLKDLRFLSNSDRAHLWSEANVASVIIFAGQRHASVILCGALTVLCDLVQHTSIEKFCLDDANAPVVKLCETCCYSNNLSVAARATQLLTLVAANCKKEMHHVEGTDISGEAVMAIEALFLLMNSGTRVTNVSILKECLQCIVRLCSVHPEACDQFVDIVGGMLVQCGVTTMPLLCEVLAALGNMKPGLLKPLLPDVCRVMSSIARANAGDMDVDDDERHVQSVSTLLTSMLLQTLRGHEWTDESVAAFKDLFESVDGWSAYRMGRNACRHGHYAQARSVFARVALKVSSEHLYFWLTGLQRVCEGESLLLKTAETQNMSLLERVTGANAKILLGMTAISAATTPFKNQEFQIQYLRCRCEMLLTLGQVISSCNGLRTSPPPAISSSLAKLMHDDLQKCGRITQLLRQCVKDLTHVSLMFSDLYQSSFDADPDTLVHVQLLQQLNACLAQWIEMVCLKSSLQGSIFNDLGIEFSVNLPKPKEEFSVDIQELISTGERISDCFKKVSSDPSVQPITDAHTNCLLSAVAMLTCNPLCLPRFFFQSLQQTSLKLAVTPQPRSAGEPVPVSTSTQLAVKVEGVISGADRAKVKAWRSVHSIQITVQSTLVSAFKTTAAAANAAGKECSQLLEQRAVPHNDFFMAQFLIPFPVAGTHQVTIETQFVDAQEERLWKTGQKLALNVKAFEDGQNRPTGGAGMRGGQAAAPGGNR